MGGCRGHASRALCGWLIFVAVGALWSRNGACMVFCEICWPLVLVGSLNGKNPSILLYIRRKPPIFDGIWQHRLNGTIK